MVKVQSSTSEVVMNYYKKYNISLKYEETKNEQPFVSYTLSLFNGNNKIFTDHETQYFKNKIKTLNTMFMIIWKALIFIFIISNLLINGL